MEGNGAALRTGEDAGFIEPVVAAARMMIGLPDIADLTETVDIGGYPVELRGVSLDTIAKSLVESDEVRRLFAAEIDASSIAGLLTAVPGSIARCVADAVGKPGDIEQIDRFRRLPSGYQLRIVDALIRLSFPGGLSPFVDMVGGWFGYHNASKRLASAGRGLGSSSRSSPQR